MNKASRSASLARRLREVLLDGKWIANTNYHDQLEELSLQDAQFKTGNHNSIAMLTYHINYYMSGMLHFFNTGEMKMSDRFSFDMPPLETDLTWVSLKSEFFSNAEKFIEHVESMSESMLDEIFINEQYGTYERNIEAVIEHSYYHLGQISLIRKLIPS